MALVVCVALTPCDGCGAVAGRCYFDICGLCGTCSGHVVHRSGSAGAWIIGAVGGCECCFSLEWGVFLAAVAVGVDDDGVRGAGG